MATTLTEAPDTIAKTVTRDQTIERRSQRQARQREVESLLEQIRRRVLVLQRLQQRGARAPAVTEREQEVDRLRRRLARLVASSPA
jgi:hypothetical protein